MGTSDINSAGSSVDAYQGLPNGNYGFSKPTETIGTTTFNSDNGSLTDGVITYSGPLGGGSDGASGLSNAAYESVLKGCIYVDDSNSGTGTGVVTLSGLQKGATYEVQLWNAYNVGTYRETIYSSGNSVDVAGNSYVIGKFVATTPSLTIDFNGANDLPTESGIGELNAIALREIPEPSAYALMLGGLAFLGILARRKSVLARF